MKKFIATIFIGLCFSETVFAVAVADASPKSSPYYIGAYGGYGRISGGYKNDGNAAQGRFVWGMHVKEFNFLMLGSELGIQSGNTMRLETSSSIVNSTSALPPQAVLKPILDLLFTLTGQFQPNAPLFYILKAGIAFRQLQLEDRTAARDNLSKVAPELQAGLGIHITEHVLLTAFYQGIYSHRNAGISLDNAGNTSISHIPTQQAGFLGIEYSLS